MSIVIYRYGAEKSRILDRKDRAVEDILMFYLPDFTSSSFVCFLLSDKRKCRILQLVPLPPLPSQQSFVLSWSLVCGKHLPKKQRVSEG